MSHCSNSKNISSHLLFVCVLFRVSAQQTVTAAWARVSSSVPVSASTER